MSGSWRGPLHADKKYRESTADADKALQHELLILADRIGWEERSLLDAAAAVGIDAAWLDDGRMCLGPGDLPPRADAVVLVRSKSFVRGPLLAAMLEAAGATVVNSAAATEICADKLKTLQRLHTAGLPAVPFRLVLTRDDLDLAVAQLGLPLVLKPLMGGFGRCVMLGRDADLVHAVYDYVEHHARGFERALLAQPVIAGADVRVIVGGGEVVTAISRVPEEDWRANVAVGAGATTIAADSELRSLVAEVSEVFDLHFAGIDLFETADGYLVSEVNHVPEFRRAAAVSGVDIAPRLISRAMAAGV